MHVGLAGHRLARGAADAIAAMRNLVATTIAFFALMCPLGLAHAESGDAERVWLARHPDTTLRVLVWNVDRSFFRENAGILRVLDAVDADLLMLDEMPPGVSAEEIADALPAHTMPWQVLYGSGGGPHQRASISVRATLQRVPEFDQLPYPRERFEAWVKAVPPEKQQRALGSLEAGVATVAGVVEWQGRRLLVVGLDLECCGDSDDSPQEQRRQFEAGAIRAAIDAVAEGLKIDAVLVGGDFNTVQGDTPVRIMQRGASASTSLTYPTPRHRDNTAADWTWDGRGTPYPSRRIDYLLHSDRLRVVQSQVFDSEDLAPCLQQALKLDAELSRALSPHRPIVVDFAWREATGDD